MIPNPTIRLKGNPWLICKYISEKTNIEIESTSTITRYKPFPSSDMKGEMAAELTKRYSKTNKFNTHNVYFVASKNSTNKDDVSRIESVMSTSSIFWMGIQNTRWIILHTRWRQWRLYGRNLSVDWRKSRCSVQSVTVDCKYPKSL